MQVIRHQVSTVLIALGIRHQYFQYPPTVSETSTSRTAANQVLDHVKSSLHDAHACACANCCEASSSRAVQHVEAAPIYLQWAGHCVVVIGVEQRVTGQNSKSTDPEVESWNLIVLDPSMIVVREGREMESEVEVEQALLCHRLWCGGEDAEKNSCGYSIAALEEFEILQLPYR